MPRGQKPHPVDVHVGRQLRTQRVLLGLSQAALAKKFDISFQQLQKYETGTNRISVSRLWQASRILDVPISYFFEGPDGKADTATDILSTRAGLELVRDFEGCSEEVRKTVYLLCKDMAGDVRPVSRKKAN
jgi:transcriptional regulator with XRE-family HTH domain